MNTFNDVRSTDLGDYSVVITTEGRITRILNVDENFYVPLPHGSEYSIKMWNRASTRCDAKVSIDGQDVGTWRIPAREYIKIERPSNISRKFTFYEEGTSESKQAGITSGGDSNGLVSVRFIPEKYREIIPMFFGDRDESIGMFGSRDGMLGVRDITVNNTTRVLKKNERYDAASKCMMKKHSNSTSGMRSGGTGLGDKSSQNFTTTSAIVHDTEKAVTITIRLIVEDTVSDKVYEPAIIPLRRMETMVPPRI